MSLIHAINFWTSNVGHLLLAINVIICLMWSKRFPGFFRWFTAFLITGLLIQVVALVLWYQGENNLPLLHLYTFFEFVFLSLFYQSLLRELKLKYFVHFILFGAVLILLNSLFIQPLIAFNSNAKTFTQLTYLGYAVTYIFGLPHHDRYLLNRVNYAVLIYYSASLFIFMFTNVLTGLQDMIPFYHYLWIVNIFLDIVFQSMVLHALLKTRSWQISEPV